LITPAQVEPHPSRIGEKSGTKEGPTSVRPQRANCTTAGLRLRAVAPPATHPDVVTGRCLRRRMPLRSSAGALLDHPPAPASLYSPGGFRWRAERMVDPCAHRYQMWIATPNRRVPP
jgi:hypothetical protein